MQVGPNHKCTTENVTVRRPWGMRMNRFSSRYYKTLIQTTFGIWTRAATRGLQDQEAQHSGRRISGYVLVLITLFSKLIFPASILTLKIGVLRGPAQLFSFLVRSFLFYYLHVMIDGVNFKIPPYFHSPSHPPYLNLSYVKLYGLSLCFCYNYESLVLHNPLEKLFQHLSHVTWYSLNLCFANFIDCLFSNFVLFIPSNLVKPCLCIKNLKGNIGSWFFTAFLHSSFFLQRKWVTNCIMNSCCFNLFFLHWKREVSTNLELLLS